MPRGDRALENLHFAAPGQEETSSTITEDPGHYMPTQEAPDMKYKPWPTFNGAALLAAMALGSCVQGESAAPSEAKSSGGGQSSVPPTNPAVLPILASEHQGIDVSSHSGTVDWNAILGADIGFALLKATEGVDLQDSAFADHWQAAKEAGIIRGAYHFYVTEDDPEEQAKFFIENVTLEPGDLVPVVDIEMIGHNTSAGLAGRLKTWLSRIEQHYGVKPIIYTSPNFWNQHLNDEFGEYPLWVAEYEVDRPRIPKGWKNWHLWQWQDNAPVAGVEKGADLNRVNRDVVDLSVLSMPAKN